MEYKKELNAFLRGHQLTPSRTFREQITKIGEKTTEITRERNNTNHKHHNESQINDQQFNICECLASNTNISLFKIQLIKKVIK